MDIFSPLAASGGCTHTSGRTHTHTLCSGTYHSSQPPMFLSASGLALLHTLSALTGLEVRAPMGLTTGSFQSSESAAHRTDSSGLKDLVWVTSVHPLSQQASHVIIGPLGCLSFLQILSGCKSFHEIKSQI